MPFTAQIFSTEYGWGTEFIFPVIVYINQTSKLIQCLMESYVYNLINRYKNF
jgi:hypothetical protein